MINKIFKKSIFLIMIISIVFNTNLVFAASTEAGQEMRTQVLYLAGIIDDDLNMQQPVTRAQFAKIIAKSSKYKDSTFGATTTAVFSDVPMTNAYASYIKVVTTNGYINGYLGGLYKPNDYVTYSDLIRACLALLDWTNSDFTGDQINGRYQKFCSLELNTNISASKTIGEYVTKLEVVNAIYNTLKAKNKSGSVYGVSVFEMTVNTDGELNASGLLKVNMQGPFVMKRGQTLYDVLPFSPENANYFLNGTSSSFSNISAEVLNQGFVVLYYNETTKTVYVYKEGTSPDTTVSVTSGYVTHIYYSASDTLTPASVEIEQARYSLANTDVKFAFSYAGTCHVGDRVIFIYQKSNDTSSEDSDSLGSYAGSLTSVFLYDTQYDN